MSRYYVVEERDNAGCFAAVVVFFVVLAVLLYFFAYIALAVLGVMVGVGLLIGFVYALIVYVRGFRDAVGECSSPYSGAVGFLHSWLLLFLYTVRGAWVHNIDAIRDMWGRFCGYSRLLSFRKWMWFVAIPAVFLGTIGMTLAVTWLQLFLILTAASFILTLSVAVAAVMLVFLLVAGIVFLCRSCGGAIGTTRVYGTLDFSTNADMGSLRNGYLTFLSGMRDFTRELWSLHCDELDRFRPSSSSAILYTLQGILYVTAAVVFLVERCLLLAVAWVLGVVGYSLVWLVDLLWVGILSFFRLFRR